MGQENYDNTKMRLQILLDAYQTTKLPKVRVKQGSYLYTEDAQGWAHSDGPAVVKGLQEQQICHMCLLGTMVLKQLTKTDPNTLKGVNFHAWDLASLKEHFDVETLALAEALFERHVVRAALSKFWNASEMEYEKGVNEVAHSLPRLDYTPRAQAILQHMIENKGRVNLDQLRRSGYIATPGTLGDKVLLVLKSYDINPFAVEQGRGG